MVRVGFLLLIGCGATHAPTTSSGDCTKPLRRAAQLAACEGQVVTLVGRATRTKQPTILGVDVDVDYELTNGPALAARGKLERYVVDPQPAEATLMVASKGPGTYWALVNDGKLAVAKRH